VHPLKPSNTFIISLLVGIHLVLAFAYASITPYRTPGRYRDANWAIIPDIGAPDELQHVANIQAYLNGHLPVLDANDPNLGAHYQAHQPPLFYILAAGWAKVFGYSSLGSQGAGLTLRALNVLIGCANVLGVFYLGWWGFHRRDIALCGAAFVALLPMNLALSGAVSNDPLLYCLCTWTLAVTALCLYDGWNRKRVIVIGVLLGLAFLTKTTALALVPALLIAAFFSGAPKPTIKQMGAIVLISLILAAPWWLRNQQLYGDPFAMKAFNLAFKDSPSPQSMMALTHWSAGEYLAQVWSRTYRSSIGMFGYMDISLNPIIYLAVGIMMLLLALGAFLLLRKPEWKQYKPVVILNLTMLVMVAILYLAFNAKYFQPQARYLFPAIGPFSIFLGLGIVYYGRERWQTSFGAWIVMLTLLNLYIVSEVLPFQFGMRQLKLPANFSPR